MCFVIKHQNPLRGLDYFQNHLKQDRQSSPENATFHKFYSTENETELLIQAEFEFIKV